MPVTGDALRQAAPFDLDSIDIPLRLALLDDQGAPRIVSLWFLHSEGRLFCATHRRAWIVDRLRRNPQVGFEISTNRPPYRGLRGTGSAVVEALGDRPLLQQLTDRYLRQSNRELASWLLSRRDDEVVIEITPDRVSQWDFSDRMQEVANG